MSIILLCCTELYLNTQILNPMISKCDFDLEIWTLRRQICKNDAIQMNLIIISIILQGGNFDLKKDIWDELPQRKCTGRGKEKLVTNPTLLIP